MPFFKRDNSKKHASSNNSNSSGYPPRSPGSVSLSNSNQSTWGVPGTSAPGWSPGSGSGSAPAYAARPSQGNNLHLQVPPTQPGGSPGSAGGFISPTRTPSPGGVTPPGDASYPGGFAPQGPPPPPPPPIRNPQQDECYSWFVAIDQDNSGEISRQELQSALINDGGLMFSSNTVNYLMSIFDVDGSRGIEFREFEALWNYITQWRQMFESFDVDRNGQIDADELGRALAHYDLRVGPTVLDLLVKKYASPPPPRNKGLHYGAPPPPPQINLDRFVCACVVVRQMCELYDQCSGHGAAQISRDDFIKAVISLP